MEKKEVIVGRPVTAGEVTVFPVAEVSLSHRRIGDGISFYGAKRPVSLVVVSPSGSRAFRITGEEVTLDQLIQEVPGIEEALPYAAQAGPYSDSSLRGEVNKSPSARG